MFTPKTPYLTVDGIIEIYKDDLYQGIVLIERGYEPFGFALPGGFVDVGESVETALKREMKEETTLEVSELKLLNIYSDPTRDRRFHTVSAVYICRASGIPHGEDDAKSAMIVNPHELDLASLCFDHAKIIEDYLTILDV
jgi:8-oxo-dGTP diphosphatase